jgi:effector-binding domain-containing protein
MPYDVKLDHHAGLPLAVVRRRAPASELASVVPQGCGVVWAFVRAHSLRAGRNVALYWDSAINLEVGVELSGAFDEQGEVVRSATPAGLTASAVHFGPYNQLGAAHKAIRDWCNARNHRLLGPNWEVYGHWQPQWDSDPSRIRTDVFYQVASASASPSL